ncbi:TyeA family type III secretion system gatekeeper subunit [Pseudomonas fluorescens]|nr:TyeA family type III secretion system gatekeeper subunit [Pseudomonas fluorescens]
MDQVSPNAKSRNVVQTELFTDQGVNGRADVTAPPKADELAHLFGQEVELNSRALSGRQMTLRVPPVEHYAQLYDQLGHPAKKTLAYLSMLFRRQLQNKPTVEKLLTLAEGDPARAFVVLKHVMAKTGSEVRQSDRTSAHDVIAELEDRFKGEIRAGLNTALALQSVGVDSKECQALRLLYYANVVTRQSLSTMMQALLGVYGGEQFHVGLQVMSKALADDLMAKVSSTPKPLLHTLLQGLRDCGRLSSVLAGCNELIGRLGIEHDAVGLLQRLLAYAGGGIEAAEALRLANDLGGVSSLRQLLALQAIYPLFKQLPLALWSDNQVRRDTLARLVTVVDELDRHMRGPTRHAGEPRTMT